MHKGERMKVWYDACTGKHVRYGVAIARRLRNLGYDVVLTTRKHPDTVPLANFLKEKFIVIGKYDPRSLLTRVKEGSKRQLFFCKLFEKSLPDVAISHGSVDLCRVSFGLGIPTVTTLDTPYADAVHRLTLPLSSYVVSSKAIPERMLKSYNPEGQFVRFNGVDEVAWIKGFAPLASFDFKKPLIVVREYEKKAVYAKGNINLLRVAKRLTKLGTVVFLSRYKSKKIKGVITPKGFVDSASLVAQADLFVGAGGTITREAALQGTPAIIVNILKKQHVNDFLIKKGFPIFKVNVSNVLKVAGDLLGKRFDVKSLLDTLENPVDIIVGIVKKMNCNS
ncbi:MAG TPA: DUF354 domain-containing protein [Candidatus Bathyarchaeota archaeon]|nr:DUF354 domain-containing protein [Candidatus Bathyarchaeota archaeon]